MIRTPTILGTSRARTQGIVAPVIQNLEPRVLRGLRGDCGNGHRRDYKQLATMTIWPCSYMWRLEQHRHLLASISDSNRFASGSKTARCHLPRRTPALHRTIYEIHDDKF